MADYTLPPCVTLVFGRTGCKKTTFSLRYIANALTPQPANDDVAACVFIFDWKLEASQRFGVPAITTEAGFENALASRLVIFNPHMMFPGDQRVTNLEGDKVVNDDKMALRWFCKKVYEVSKRGPGKKTVFIDELRQFTSRHYIPPELNLIARQGRSEHLELLTCTQFPGDYHQELRGAVTEWVCFSTTEPAQLDAVRPYYPDVDKVAALGIGEFIAYNRDSGAVLHGKI